MKAASRIASRASSARPRVGLAFGGGLPFGAVAIGVIDVLEQNRIPIDCLAGTSMGSIIALLYAYGYSPGELAELFTRFFTRRRLIPALLRDLRPSRAGFVQGNSITRTLANLIPEDTTFESLQIPLAVPAADLLTGQEVVFRSGPVFPAIRASISLPGIFTPFEYGDTFLVDGAVISPIPVHLLGPLGADVEIPVRAVRQRPNDVRQRIADLRNLPDKGHAKHSPPDLLRLLWRSLSLIMQDQFAELLFEQCDLYLKPEVPFDMAGNPEKVPEIVAIGRSAAEAQLPAIRAAIAAASRRVRRPTKKAPLRAAARPTRSAVLRVPPAGPA